jgi:hypothetical protein
MNHLNVVKYGRDHLAPRPEYKFPDQPPDYFLANGQFHPTIAMRPGQVGGSA